MTKNMYRHGDILLLEIERMPEDTIKTNNRVLAEGETTGHKHLLVGGNVVTHMKNNEPVAIEVLDLTNLVHEEHKPINIPRGKYEIVRERDYNPYEQKVRKVFD